MELGVHDVTEWSYNKAKELAEQNRIIEELMKENRRLRNLVEKCPEGSGCPYCSD